MASTREITPDISAATGADDEDARNGQEGKKRRFKPLSAVRKLFGGRSKRKKDDAVVTVKAHSTTALHTSRYGEGDDDDDDDDDGGFKTHKQKTSNLTANTRSLSEDSVFSPEQRPEPNIVSFPTSAVSEESLPKSAFQSELFSKLNKRRSQYSDDDRDDGLPRSPVPPVTTADVIMDSPLKPPAKKTSNRDSDLSLISVDSSENEEDRLFESNWKSAVPAVRTGKRDSKNTSADSMDPLDFSSIQKTELLKSGAAKDRISIKPKTRRSSSRHVKGKRDSNSPQTLPSLNEETSPTLSKTSDTFPSDTKYSKTTTTKTTASSNNKNVTGELSSKYPTPPDSPNDQNSNAGISQKKSSSPTNKPASPGSAKLPFSSSHTHVGTSQSNASNVSTTQSLGITPKTGNTPTESVATNISKDSISSEGKTPTSPTKLAAVDKVKSKQDGGDSETTGGLSLKARMNQFQAKASGKENEEKKEDIRTNSRIPSNTSSSANNTNTKNNIYTGVGLKSLDPETKLSPKGDDYKQKRQARSKTLPGSKDESESNPSSSQNSPTVQRAFSQRVPGPSRDSKSNSPEKKPTTQIQESSNLSSTSVALASKSNTSSSSTSSTSTPQPINKLANRFSAFENKASSSDPPWKSMAKKKKEESDGKTPSNTQDTTCNNSPRSVFSSASYLGAKRGSVDSSASSGGANSKNTTPRDGNLDAGKVQSSISLDKKRESIEISVSELSSAKSMHEKSNTSSLTAATSPLPSSSSSSSSAAAASSTSTSSASERAKLFSGAAQTIPMSKTSPDSDNSLSTNKDNASAGGTSSLANRFGSSSTAASGGISHSRSASVKTSPTKSDPSRPWVSGRTGSVKVSPAFLSSSSGQNNSTPAVAVSKPTVTSSSSSTSREEDKIKTTSSTSSTVQTQNKNNTSNLPPSQNVSVTTTKTNPTSVSPPNQSITPSSSPRTTPLASDQPSALTSKPPLGSALRDKSTSNIKSVSFSSNIKPNVSSSHSTSSSSSSPRSTSASSSTTTLSASQTNLNTASSNTRTNPIRAHASFTHPSSVKPVISPASSPSINKSPSMRVNPSSTSSPSSSSTSSTKFTTPAAKKSNLDTTNKSTDKAPSSVPAWRANLATKKHSDVNIEIIESSTKPQPPKEEKSDVVLRKPKSAFSEAAKKTDPSPVTASEKMNNRSSRVLDMVKNFQNLQVST